MKDEKIKEKEAEKALKAYEPIAKSVLNDSEKTEVFIKDVEKKFKEMPDLKNTVGNVMVLFDMVKSYVKKEYREVPVGTIIAIVSALIYWLSPIDLIPDAIPVAGYVDDAAVIAFCIKMVGEDVKKYKEWKENNK